MIKRISFLICVFALVSCKNEQGDNSSNGDIDRFESEIRAFEKEDKKNGIRKNEILFVGSSSIRLWNTLEEDMAPLPVINRGFGGATLTELIHYADRVIYPYEPAIIVLYCGENDISEGASPEMVVDRFIALTNMIMENLPNTKVYNISMKPSTARWDLWPQYKEANIEIRLQCSRKKPLINVDISGLMLMDQDRVDESVYDEDPLHMNAKGYERWTRVIKKLLLKNYPMDVK